MNPFDPKEDQYFLQADANALGGYLEAPVAKLIPTLAPVSLPPVGGFAMARSEAFNFDEIVSCSSAHTRVSGQACCKDGSASILVTAVIEDLNILEVVRADRIVTQLSITISPERSTIGVSFTGTAFEGLRLAGHPCRPIINAQLQRPPDNTGAGGRVSWEQLRDVGRAQGKTLSGAFKDRGEEAIRWLESRYYSMTAEPVDDSLRYANLSLIDHLEVSGGCRSYGHIAEIPEFGRIIFGEVLASPHSVTVVGIRADLGCCPYRARMMVVMGGGGGQHDN
jgi:hypothetical protein